MTKELINQYTLKISSSNSTGIIATLFEIYFSYGDDAREACKCNDKMELVNAVKQCSKVVSHLQKDLDFKYEISKDLYSLYDFCLRSLAKSIYKADLAGLEDADKVMKKLQDAFSQIARADESKPMMANAQYVIAGMTYGRAGLNESMASRNRGPRGFYA